METKTLAAIGGICVALIASLFIGSLANGPIKQFQGGSPSKGSAPRPSDSPTLTLAGFKELASGVAFSPDGTIIATADSGAMVTLWDVRSGKRLRVLERSYTEGGVKFSANGQYIMSAWKRVWNAKNGKLLRTFQGGHTGGVLIDSVAYDPYTSTTKVEKFRRPAGLTGFIVSMNGGLIATSSDDHTTEIWDARKGRLRWTLKGHTASVEAIAFSPNTHLLVSGSQDKTIKVWSVKSGKLIWTLKGHRSTPRALSFVSNGKLLASVGESGELFLWHMTTGKLRHKRPGQNIILFPQATFSANGQRFAVRAVSANEWKMAKLPSDTFPAKTVHDTGQNIWIHDTLTGKVLYKLNTADLHSFALSRDGKMLAVGGTASHQNEKEMERIEAQVWRIP